MRLEIEVNRIAGKQGTVVIRSETFGLDLIGHGGACNVPRAAPRPILGSPHRISLEDCGLCNRSPVFSTATTIDVGDLGPGAQSWIGPCWASILPFHSISSRNLRPVKWWFAPTWAE